MVRACGLVYRSALAFDEYAHILYRVCVCVRVCAQGKKFESIHIAKKKHAFCAKPKIFYIRHTMLFAHLPRQTAFSTFSTVRRIYHLIVTTEKSETILLAPGLFGDIVSGPRGLTEEVFEVSLLAKCF